GIERVHAPFRIEVTTDLADHASVDADALLGEPAELDLAYEDGERPIHGIVDEVVQTQRGHRFVLVPRLAPLGDSCDHEVFLDQDAVSIAEAVLKAQGLDVEKRVSRTPAKRPQCVQAFESDLAFVSRILAEEGVVYFIDHGSGKDVVVFCDHASAHAPIAGGEEIPFSEGEDAGLDGAECVASATIDHASVTGKLTLRDQDFERPGVDQTASSGDGPLERYEYPGGYTDPDLGATLSAIRLEEAQALEVVLRGITSSRRLVPGATFKLTGAGRDEMNVRWLVLEVEHEGTDHDARNATNGPDRRYRASFVAVPAKAPHRPTRVATPTLGGVQTATVTAPGGAEIHTEKYGRVKALLRWDRLRKKDDTSSTWFRPVQPPTSGGFFLPRMGWEVLLGFQGASGDMP